MITCPLCQRLVLISDNFATDATPKQAVEDDDMTNPFYCPTYVNVHRDDQGGVRWGHYVRKARQNPHGFEYVAVIPPFYIYYWTFTKRVLVQQFDVYPDDWRFHKTILEQSNIELIDLPKIYQRFNNLRLFT